MKVTSSWFFLSTLNYDARSTTHQIYSCGCGVNKGPYGHSPYMATTIHYFMLCAGTLSTQNVEANKLMTKIKFKLSILNA